MTSFLFFPAGDTFMVATICVFFLTLSSLLVPDLYCESLKHSYYTKRDERSLIGPLGFPFGFLETGRYNLTVFDFQLSVPKKRHIHDPHSRFLIGGGDIDTTSIQSDIETPSSVMLSQVLDNIKGVGFLLKQFEDEVSFNQYMAQLQADPTRCVFQKYINLKEEDNDFVNEYGIYDDDFVYHDYGSDDYSGGYYGEPWMNDYDDGFDYDDRDYDDEFEEDGMRRRRVLSKQRQQQQQSKHGHRERNLSDEGEEEEGYGEVIDAVEDGIYLDMMPRSHWRPHHPSVAYNFEPGQAGLYFLIYQVCYKDISPTTAFLDIHSRFELDFHFSNVDMFGRESFLSSGEMILPLLFFCFFLMYAICLYLWISNIRLIKDGKSGYFDVGDLPASSALTISGNKFIATTPTIYPIHYLMGFLLVLKTLSLLFESIRFHYLRVIGHALFFSAVYYTFAFLKGITLFTVIVLIGSGWSFVKPFISDREKKMILGVLILQVLNNIAIVVLTQETEGENSFDRWTAILHLVDILCCCAVLIPIVWQVNQLEKNMEQNDKRDEHEGDDEEREEEEGSFLNNNRFDNDDECIPEDELDEISIDENNASNCQNGADKQTGGGPSDARMASKLKLFRSFYILVIAYIYMTRIVIYLFAATLNYKHTWIRVFVLELTTILFYSTVGYLFRPMNENPYLHLRKRKGGSSTEGETVSLEMPKIDPTTKIAQD